MLGEASLKANGRKKESLDQGVQGSVLTTNLESHFILCIILYQILKELSICPLYVTVPQLVEIGVQ